MIYFHLISNYPRTSCLGKYPFLGPSGRRSMFSFMGPKLREAAMPPARTFGPPNPKTPKPQVLWVSVNKSGIYFTYFIVV